MMMKSLTKISFEMHKFGCLDCRFLWLGGVLMGRFRLFSLHINLLTTLDLVTLVCDAIAQLPRRL